MKIDGYKTYIVAGLMAVYAIAGGVLGYHDWNDAAAMLLEAAAIAGLRHGVAKR